MSKKKINIENLNQKEIIYKLKENKRITNTRLDIIECLSDGNHHHTVNDIINHLKSKGKNLNVATVYNNLKVLLSQGIIDVYPNYNSQNQRYELVDKKSYHVHIRDFENSNESYQSIPENIINQFKELIKEKNYEIHNLKIEILVKKTK